MKAQAAFKSQQSLALATRAGQSVHPHKRQLFSKSMVLSTPSRPSPSHAVVCSVPQLVCGPLRGLFLFRRSPPMGKNARMAEGPPALWASRPELSDEAYAAHGQHEEWKL